VFCNVLFLVFLVLLSSFIFSFCIQVFVEKDNVDFRVNEVVVVFDGMVGVVFYGIVGVVFDYVMGVYVCLGVCDSFVGVAFGSLFDILTKVPSSNSNAFVAFGDQHKMANQVLGVGVVFVD
jgi:hypothetical protein